MGIAACQVCLMSKDGGELVDEPPLPFLDAALCETENIAHCRQKLAPDEPAERRIDLERLQLEKAIELFGGYGVAEMLASHPEHHLENFVLSSKKLVRHVAALV